MISLFFVFVLVLVWFFSTNPWETSFGLFFPTCSPQCSLFGQHPAAILKISFFLHCLFFMYFLENIFNFWLITSILPFSPLLSLAPSPQVPQSICSQLFEPTSPQFVFLCLPLTLPLLSHSPRPFGHCHFVLYFQVSGSILLFCFVD